MNLSKKYILSYLQNKIKEINIYIDTTISAKNMWKTFFKGILQNVGS